MATDRISSRPAALSVGAISPAEDTSGAENLLRENRSLRNALTRKQNESDAQKQEHHKLAEDHKRLIEATRALENASAVKMKEHNLAEESSKSRILQAERDLKDAAAKEQRIRSRLLDSQHEQNEAKSAVDRLKAQLNASRQHGLQDGQKKDVHIAKLEKKLKAAEGRDAALVLELQSKDREGLQMRESLMSRIRDLQRQAEQVQASNRAELEEQHRMVGEVRAQAEKHEAHNQVLKAEGKQADARESEYQIRLQKMNNQITTHETLAEVQVLEIARLEKQIQVGAKREDRLQRLVHEKEQALAEALSLNRNLEASLHQKEQDLEVTLQGSILAKQAHQDAMEAALSEVDQSHQADLQAMMEASRKAVDKARQEHQKIYTHKEAEFASREAALREKMEKLCVSVDGDQERAREWYEALQKQTVEHTKLLERHAYLKASLPDLSFGVALYR